MKTMQWKKIVLLMMLALAAVLCAACGSKDVVAATESSTVPVVLNNAEYVLYQNIFYNGYGDQYNFKSVEKQGVFTTVQDAYNGVTRYYVWGYLDNTLCCDWQWELNITDTSNLPANGSLIKVKGTFLAEDAALDGYWIRNPQIEVLTKYTGPSAEVDMCTMSDTLERVQLASIVMRSEQFEGKEFSAYGRIANPEVLEDPYYDGSWQVSFTTEATVPAIGTTVELRGTVVEGVLTASTLSIRE